MPATNKHNWLLVLFAFALITDLVAVQMELTLVRWFSKPSLMLLLIIFVWLQPLPKKLKNLLLPALFFSLAGDIFLLFDSKVSYFFILGLLSFLIAHIFFIWLFIVLKRTYYSLVKWNLLIMVALAVYVGGLFYLLYPGLGALKIPVVVYALVLSAMFVTAAHLSSRAISNPIILAGALLFVISDSLLAVNKFFHSFESAPILIMLTYGLAQLLIVTGVLKLIRSTDKH